MTIRVSVLLQNRLLRDSIARILAKRADFEVLAALSCGSGGWVAKWGEHTPQVLLLDSLEYLNSTYPARHASSGASSGPLLLAMEDDPAQFLRAVQRGAAGYVLQDASAADVVAAIRNVAEGKAVCPPQFIRILFEYIAAQTNQTRSARRGERRGLTRREQQLIPLIERGLSNKEIADHFHLSEQTVKNHVHRILRKTGVSSRLNIGEACRYSLSAIGIGARVHSKLESARSPL